MQNELMTLISIRVESNGGCNASSHRAGDLFTFTRWDIEVYRIYSLRFFGRK